MSSTKINIKCKYFRLNISTKNILLGLDDKFFKSLELLQVFDKDQDKNAFDKNA